MATPAEHSRADGGRADGGREWLALHDGRIVRVRTMAGELVPWASPRAHPVPVPLCACGAPRLHRAQSCGSAECVARLWQTR